MALYGNDDAVLKLAEKFKTHCLIEQQSILTNNTLWTDENFQELDTLYGQNLDTSAGRTFQEKLDNQLQQASNQALQLFAELYILDLLPLGNVTFTKKIENVEHILHKCNPPVSLTEEIRDTFNQGGVLNGGLGYNNYRWGHFIYLINLGLKLSSLPLAERHDALSTTEDLINTLYSPDLYEGVAGVTTLQKALCFLFDPEHFIDIISPKHLNDITKHFEEYLTEEDRELYPQQQARIISDKIREERKLPDWNFYLDREEWEPLTTPKNTAQESEELTAAEEEDEETETPLDLILPEGSAEDLLVPHAWLNTFMRTLRNKKQVILQGPPGTGKTFLAKRIASKLSGSAQRRSLIQFHPSYTYEDFFEGFRPCVDSQNQKSWLELRPGPLRTIVEHALEESEYPHFLIIDEINRGNLASIFGELYFLLEYRKEEVRLMYSGEQFSLPDNLFIVGTMNTADRSIALVDSAMRRRFAFYSLHPDSEPTQGLLQRWCSKNLEDGSRIVALWQALNREIGVHDFKVGPSYFMRADIESPGVLDEVWESEILPLVSEYFPHEQENTRDRFALQNLVEGL